MLQHIVLPERTRNVAGRCQHWAVRPCLDSPSIRNFSRIWMMLNVKRQQGSDMCEKPVKERLDLTADIVGCMCEGGCSYTAASGKSMDGGGEGASPCSNSTTCCRHQVHNQLMFPTKWYNVSVSSSGMMFTFYWELNNEMRFGNDCILILFTFKAASLPFWNWESCQPSRQSGHETLSVFFSVSCSLQVISSM